MGEGAADDIYPPPTTMKVQLPSCCAFHILQKFSQGAGRLLGVKKVQGESQEGRVPGGRKQRQNLGNVTISTPSSLFFSSYSHLGLTGNRSTSALQHIPVLGQSATHQTT
ncbi:hypothetical protein NPIL_395001 [Nephila pilipes]|uniref:Uncharacterized protein n=1 Tax=Nephila pilipes TaxID=299642 RepID=A0A8X6NB87_NEPPI|nr:hypothetical protein NPIL_395001 [Nephila pilipes]